MQKAMLFVWCVAVPLLAVTATNYVPKNKFNHKEYTAYVKPWGECLRERLGPNGFDISTDDLKHTTVLGVQHREVQCRRKDSTLVNKSNCEDDIKKIGISRMCIVRQDCQLGDWNPWRPRSDGSQVRTRVLRILPQGGGTVCDVIEEVKPVALDPTAHWVPGPWGTCNVAMEQPTPCPVPNDDDDDDTDEDMAIYEDTDKSEDVEDKETITSCGGGVQRREATCVRADGSEIHPAQCAHTPTPTLVQPCEVPCPRDCEVGEWGEWSPCQPTDGCPLYPVQQLTSAGFSVRRRRVVSAASGGGAPCPPLEEKRSCNNPKCASWHALPWGPCVLSQAHSSCGPGRRSRDLRCLEHDGTEADRAWCSTGAPARSERCRIACPGDCVVSSWSTWSPCSATCANPSHPRPYRTRRRHILAHSSPTGWPCPLTDQLIQNETCNAHACATYSWLATPWGPCERREQDFIAANYTDLTDTEPYNESDDEEPCIEEGEMNRDVMCVQDNADVVRESLCSPLRRPASRRACTVRCRRGCKLESWQPWSTCPNTCSTSKQTRTRVVHGGPSCGPREESRECPLPRTCLEQMQWATTNWSTCVLAPGQACGSGYRIRSLWCESGGRRVETGLCAGRPAPPTVQHCNTYCKPIPPPTCNVVCQQPLRYLDEVSENVPNCVCKNITLELMPADSDCILPPGAECGEGKVLRAARCLFEGRDVPIDVCKKYHPLTGSSRVREASTDGYSYDAEFPGVLRGACSVRCARDCALGPWGEWGPCAAEPASRTAFRFRTREVIEEGSGGGRECGATLQRATCMTSEPRWEVGEWSVCAAQRAICGHALQTRTVRCVGSGGLLLEESECELSGAGPAPARETTCRAPCPADCVVSSWSEWSPCGPTKWGGRRDRTRVVLRAAAEGGGACPALVAGEDCAPARYSWHVAPWDDCQPLGGSPCGEGLKKRAVRCLRSDGVFVDDSFCPNTTASESKESWCYVPCGVDCELGEWGPWDTSACSCGRTTTVAHMRRTRQHLTSAAWPGRACPPAEQRAPCPREPCLRPVVPPPSLVCNVQTTHGSNAKHVCGWGTHYIQPRCEIISTVDDSSTNLWLGPWRCTQPLPGRLVVPPYEYQEETCEIGCGCNDVEPVPAAPWGEWGPCRGGARSRSRQLTAPLQQPSSRCKQTSKYVTIQWENCTNESEVPDLLAIEPEEERPRREWLEKDPYQDVYTEGTGSVLTVVWASTLILSMYGGYVLYRALVRYVKSRQVQKTIAKV